VLTRDGQAGALPSGERAKGRHGLRIGVG